MEFVDGVTNCGVTLFKTVEALSSGAFFLSTSVELKTKGAGGGQGRIGTYNFVVPGLSEPLF